MFKKKKEKEPVGPLKPIRIPADPKLKADIKATIVITGDEKTRIVTDEELKELEA